MNKKTKKNIPEKGDGKNKKLKLARVSMHSKFGVVDDGTWNIYYKGIKKAKAPLFDFYNKGCRGRRIKIEPEKSDIIGDDTLIQKGKVIAVGPESRCKVGDTVIFSTDGFDKVTLGDESFYYVLDTDQFIYEIL